MTPPTASQMRQTTLNAQPRTSNFGQRQQGASAGAKKPAVTSSLAFYAEHKAKIPDLPSAITLLEERGWIPPLEEPNGGALVAGMDQLALSVGSAVAVEGLIALAIYAKAVLEARVSVAISEEIMVAVQDKVYEAVEAAIAESGALADSREEVARANEELTGSSVRVEAGLARVEKMCGQIQETATRPVGTFAEVAAARAQGAPAPGRTPAPQGQMARVVDRAKLRARQLLVDNVALGDEEGVRITEEVVVLKANVALSMMKGEGDMPPAGGEVVAATVLRNGGVVLEFGTQAGADWVRETKDRSAAFASKMGTTAEVKGRQYKVVAEFVPVRFNPDDAAALRAIEERGQLPAGSIVYARWIKPVGKRQEGQQVAHVMLTLSSSSSANCAIANGLIIAGKKVGVRRCLLEPLRCAKCHRFEPVHLARDCTQTEEQCGTCGDGSHPTRDCQVTDEAKFRCVNCKRAGHTTWSRQCPTFLAQLQKMQQRQPDHGFRFFPTEDPQTWEVEPSFQDSFPGSAGRPQDDGWNTVGRRGTHTAAPSQQMSPRRMHQQRMDDHFVLADRMPPAFFE